MGTVARYRELGLNRYQGNKHKNSLLKKGFIRIEPVPTSSARIKLMVPTRQGFMWLKSRGFTVNGWPWNRPASIARPSAG